MLREGKSQRHPIPNSPPEAGDLQTKAPTEPDCRALEIPGFRTPRRRFILQGGSIFGRRATGLPRDMRSPTSAMLLATRVPGEIHMDRSLTQDTTGQARQGHPSRSDRLASKKSSTGIRVNTAGRLVAMATRRSRVSEGYLPPARKVFAFCSSFV